MSVSSHLNPEPERRLWIIHENLRRSQDWTDLKLGALGAFAALELALGRFLLPPGAAAYAAGVLLAAALPLCVFAVSPFIERPPRVPLPFPSRGKPRPEDSLLNASDLEKYTQMELVIILDKYLGGGITATPYYEDIVGQILTIARVTCRKARFFAAAAALALAAQLLLLGRLAFR